MDTPGAKERRIIRFAKLCWFIFLASIQFRYAWNATTVSSQVTRVLLGVGGLLIVAFDLIYSTRKVPRGVFYFGIIYIIFLFVIAFVL